MLKKPLFIAIVAGVVIASDAMISNNMKTSESKPVEAAKDFTQGAGNEAVDLADLSAIEIKEIPNRPEGARAKVNGIEMYYEIFGAGEPLLLIHGGGATIESWFCQIPEFAGKYKVIAVDSRGHGRTTDGNGPISFELMAADFAALLDLLGLKNVMILGWSDGGVIGLELAIRRRDLVRKVITLGAHARPAGMAAEFKAEVEGATPENFPPMLVEGYKALSPDGPEHWPVVFGKLKTLWLTLPDFKDEELRGIQCPVLLLAGEHDIVREEESTRMASLIPKARLKILKGATHYSPVQIPDIVNKEIIGFLGEP